MITQIKPVIHQQSQCPYCGNALKANGLLWQGIHICVQFECSHCVTSIVEDLRVGHAIQFPYQLDLNYGRLFGKGNPNAEEWLGKPFLKSLQQVEQADVTLEKEVFNESKRVIILNCIDYLYGHCVLKLLNVQRHLHQDQTYGLVVIVPAFLRWLVPDGVAEIWTVHIPLRAGQRYYPCINEFIMHECKRFDEIYVSEAHAHPGYFNLSDFTRVPQHDLSTTNTRITFIWREDRLWINPWLDNDFMTRVISKLRMYTLLVLVQNRLIQTLFKHIKVDLPDAKFAVAGFGKRTRFPDWIEDVRVDQFDAETERQLCQTYAQSRLVIGVHGSNMLLPSGQAGMTIDLMPDDRWGNVVQDILYQERDSRIAAFRYRYIPIQTPPQQLAKITASMVLGYPQFHQSMTADQSL